MQDWLSLFMGLPVTRTASGGGGGGDGGGGGGGRGGSAGEEGSYQGRGSWLTSVSLLMDF